MRRLIDHHRNSRPQLLVGGELRQRWAIDAGIGHHNIGEPLAHQRDGLRNEERQDSLETVEGQRITQGLGAAQRLGGHANGQPAGAGDHGACVAVKGVDVHRAQRRDARSRAHALVHGRTQRQ